jgi:hypothetical protein
MGRQLIQLRPRQDQHYIGRSHSILIVGSEGFVEPSHSG